MESNPYGKEIKKRNNNIYYDRLNKVESKFKSKADLNNSYLTNRSAVSGDSKIYEIMDKKSRYLMAQNIVGRFKRNIYN